MPAISAEKATVKVSVRTRDDLRLAARQDGTSMQDLLDKLVANHMDQLLLDEMNAAFAQAKAGESDDDRAERDSWDSTLLDGLGEDEA